MSDIKISVDNRVATLTIQREAVKNAISSELRTEEFIPALRDIRENDDAKVLLIETAGNDLFSAGGNLKEVLEIDFDPTELRAIEETWTDLYWELQTLGKPTVAKVDGDMYAGAANMSMYIDVVVAIDDARIGWPEVNRGIFEWFSASRLPHFIGPRMAMYMLLTGDTLSATEAVQHGLITKAVPSDELDSEVESVVQMLLEQSPRTLKLLKKSVYKSIEMSPESAFEEIKKDALEMNRSEPPMIEGITAFLEKREPEWES
jgi:enoyl-CoA hydratase/carnithine racemase